MKNKEKIAMECLGYPGRMISGSKSQYREIYPDNLPIFNANICVEGGKIWWGDLDLVTDKVKLSQLAQNLGETIYVLFEHDGRFENEKKPKLEKAIVEFDSDGKGIVCEHYLKYGEIYKNPIKKLTNSNYELHL